MGSRPSTTVASGVGATDVAPSKASEVVSIVEVPSPSSPASLAEDLEKLPYTKLPGISECHGLQVPGLDKPLWRLVADTAERYPDRDALVSMWQQDWDASGYPAVKTESAPPSPAYIRWSYASLVSRASQLAAHLSSQGCVGGDPLVAFLWNSAEWALFFWAAAKLEMVFVPLDPRALGGDVKALLGAVDPAVVVVQDPEAAEKVDQSEADVLAKLKTKVCCNVAPPKGWDALAEVAKAAKEKADATTSPASPEPTTTDPATPCLIVFTSGTTSRPKGCPHTVGSLWSQAFDYDPNPADYFDRWLVHTPVSHVFAVNNALRGWIQGGAVTFPSKSFDVAASLRALVDEQCSFMSAVPTLVKALMAQPNYPGKDKLALKFISLGGTVIREQDIRFCKDNLGAETAIQAFGMSEGAPVISWARPDRLLTEGGGFHTGVGRILPGCNMRICNPGEKTPLKTGEVGELHIGGTSIITGYLHGVGADNFYTDEVGNWLVTGDQARIDEDGILYMMGRYKDLIIRGGENIAPVKIELALSELPALVQVVGAPDELAGQVPVAVVKDLENCSKADLLKQARTLGPMYALDNVYTLKQLGLETFPMTATGKIKKVDLQKVVAEYREKLAAKESVVEPVNAATVETVGVPETAEAVTIAEANGEVQQPAALAPAPEIIVAVEEKPKPEITAVKVAAEPEISTAIANEQDELPVTPETAISSKPKTNGQIEIKPEHNGDPTLAILDVLRLKSTVGAESSEVKAEPKSVTATSPAPAAPAPAQSTADKLCAIWEDMVGLYPDPEDDVTLYADSITVLRFCDRVLHELGQRLYLQDFADARTVALQAELLDSRSGMGLLATAATKGAGFANGARQKPFGGASINVPPTPPRSVNGSGFGHSRNTSSQSWAAHSRNASLNSLQMFTPPGSGKLPFAPQFHASSASATRYGAVGFGGVDVSSPDYVDPTQAIGGLPPSLSAVFSMFASPFGALQPPSQPDPLVAYRDQAIALVKSHRLAPQDIEDILPVKDFFRRLCVGQRPQSYVNRVVFGLKGKAADAPPERVRKALEVGVASRPMFRTLLGMGGTSQTAEPAPTHQYGRFGAPQPQQPAYAFGTSGADEPFHVVLCPSPRVLARVVSEVVLSDPAEYEAFITDDSFEAHDSSLMFEAVVVTVASTGATFLRLTYSHSVFDMMSIMPWYQDLDLLLSQSDPASTGARSLVALTPFRLYADLTRTYAQSAPAQASVAANVARLRGISRFRGALMPRQRAPGWMIASDALSPLAAARDAVRARIWAADFDAPSAAAWPNAGLDAHNNVPAAFRYPRASRVVTAGTLNRLRVQAGVDAQVVTKAAVALWNVLQTGEKVALFTTLHAAREWPFVPPWMGKLLPPAMSVDGPMVEWAVDMVEPLRSAGWAGEETVKEMLGRLAAEHEEVGRHAHAPWHAVLAALGPDEAEVAVEASFRQAFVWDISLRLLGGVSQYGNMSVERRYDWPDCGLFWNCCMIDQSNLFIVASWDTAQLNETEVEEYCDGVADVLRKLASPDNWDKSVREVFFA